MKKLQLLFVSIMGLLLLSCASGYQEIEPSNTSYASSTENMGVLLNYKYNVISKKKYQKKEIKKGVRIVAVKLTNGSDRDLIFGKDIKLVNSNGMTLSLLNNSDTYDFLKQKSGFYFFYLLLSGVSVYTEDSDGDTTNYPVGLVAGTGLALGNFFVAQSANKKFNSELLSYDLLGKTIKSGETVYGLIGLKTDSPEQLNMEISGN